MTPYDGRIVPFLRNSHIYVPLRSAQSRHPPDVLRPKTFTNPHYVLLCSCLAGHKFIFDFEQARIEMTFDPYVILICFLEFPNVFVVLHNRTIRREISGLSDIYKHHMFPLIAVLIICKDSIFSFYI